MPLLSKKRNNVGHTNVGHTTEKIMSKQQVPKTLQTGISSIRNVGTVSFGSHSMKRDLPAAVERLRQVGSGSSQPKTGVFFVDHFFENRRDALPALPTRDGDEVLFVDTTHEPKTTGIDRLTETVRERLGESPAFVVGIGGGTTMDTAKAVSNLLGNGGKAEDYQGWDLLTKPGIPKIAVPTLSGTGAEATRTCVMTNERTGLKLGMNSHYTVFDHVILDPTLTKTVPRNQYFYSGMDAYIHSFESLNGLYRNPIGDAFSKQCIATAREVFKADDMMEDDAREQLMVASYFGGVAIGAGYVGVLHPFSAALSVVLGIHHCEANCITMRGMEKFYPAEFDEFWALAEKQNVTVPSGIARNLSDDQYRALISSTVIHEKPLTNALGEDFRSILTDERIIEIFKSL